MAIEGLGATSIYTTNQAKFSSAAQRVDATEAEEVSQVGSESEAVNKNQDSFQRSATLPEETGIYQSNKSIAAQLKADQEAIQLRFLDMVRNTLQKQGKNVAAGDGIWKQIAKGDFQVDAATQAEAKKAISDDGYWGVKQTSERLVGFAKALVGGDPSRVEEMRAAFVKGFKAAENAWGGSLPGIAGETYDATMKLFDEWAAQGNQSD